MKKVKDILKRFINIPYMKYIVVLVLGVVLIGFVGSNSVLAHFGYKQRISELNDEIEYYEGEYSRDQARIHQLQTDPKAMEEIARERYFMKHADEDIFVLSDDERDPLAKKSADETVE
ncbi:MAG: septum formation initiator family protein [Prevotella sp.]|nr:septum formation initiator family protein [Prevotella sp.]